MRSEAWIAVLCLTAALAGCLGDEASENDEDLDKEGPRTWYRPINDQGELDLIDPTPAPRDTSPTCRVIDVASAYRVLDLQTAVAWDASSARTEELRLSLATGSAIADVSVEGPSPLDLTAPEFNVTAGEKFGLVLSLIGEEPTDSLSESQTFEFKTHFVARLDEEHRDADLGMWSSECPA